MKPCRQADVMLILAWLNLRAGEFTRAAVLAGTENKVPEGTVDRVLTRLHQADFLGASVQGAPSEHELQHRVYWKTSRWSMEAAQAATRGLFTLPMLLPRSEVLALHRDRLAKLAVAVEQYGQGMRFTAKDIAAQTSIPPSTVRDLLLRIALGGGLERTPIGPMGEYEYEFHGGNIREAYYRGVGVKRALPKGKLSEHRVQKKSTSAAPKFVARRAGRDRALEDTAGWRIAQWIEQRGETNQSFSRQEFLSAAAMIGVNRGTMNATLSRLLKTQMLEPTAMGRATGQRPNTSYVAFRRSGSWDLRQAAVVQSLKAGQRTPFQEQLFSRFRNMGRVVAGMALDVVVTSELLANQAGVSQDAAAGFLRALHKARVVVFQGFGGGRKTYRVVPGKNLARGYCRVAKVGATMKGHLGLVKQALEGCVSRMGGLSPPSVVPLAGPPIAGSPDPPPSLGVEAFGATVEEVKEVYQAALQAAEAVKGLRQELADERRGRQELEKALESQKGSGHGLRIQQLETRIRKQDETIGNLHRENQRLQGIANEHHRLRGLTLKVLKEQGLM